MIQAVVFDMDGVLFDTERVYNEAWHEVAESWPIQADLDDLIVRCVGLNHTDTRRLFDDMLGEDFPFDAYIGRIGARFHEMVEEELPVKEGVREILRWLKEQKIPTALATSTSREGALSHLQRTGILSEPYIESEINRRIYKRVMESYSDFRVVKAELKNTAGLLGASVIAFKNKIGMYEREY